jgi:glycosyltransferase involved in cell wall biosynthesis
MISVVIPAYNAEKFLPDTLDSILEQTMQAFEIIVVDDGSTDRTVEIVRGYSAKDNRIRLILNHHGRQSNARNTAIRVARYDWIAPIDADDIILPDRFEKQLQAAAAYPEVVAWGTYSQLTTADGTPYRTRQDRPTTLAEFDQMKRNGELFIMPNSSCLLRKDVVVKAGYYDPRFDNIEDVEILIRMAAYGPILVVPEVLMQYRMHASSTTGAYQSFLWQRKMFIFLEERNKCRLKGDDLLLDDYLAEYDEAPAWKRLLRHVDNLSAFQLKMAALYYGESKHLNLLQSMLLSFVLNPYYVSHRVLNRFILRRNFVNYRV